MILPRNEAEERYGFRLYQGGAVPGERLRIVSIDGLDTEACGGTHLRNTSEAVRITMMGTKKIQDGILRLEYVAGKRAQEMYEEDISELSAIMGLIGVQDPDMVVERCEGIFSTWKRLRKFNSRSRKMDPTELSVAIEEVRSDIEGNAAMLILDHWRSVGSPEQRSDDFPRPDLTVTRPQEYLQQASSVFKVQKSQLWRTSLRFLKEMGSWLEDMR
ncbi:MAG: hypothetical protein ACMUHY_03565 [Thermoplasmatota archaeon]